MREDRLAVVPTGPAGQGERTEDTEGAAGPAVVVPERHAVHVELLVGVAAQGAVALPPGEVGCRDVVALRLVAVGEDEPHRVVRIAAQELLAFVVVDDVVGWRDHRADAVRAECARVVSDAAEGKELGHGTVHLHRSGTADCRAHHPERPTRPTQQET